MQFDSLQAALQMDGHGSYVWFVVVVSIVTLALMLIMPVLRKRQIMTQQRGLLRREQYEESRAPGS